jgi:hypothetical protein
VGAAGDSATLPKIPCISRASVSDFRWLAGPICRTEDRIGSALALPLMKLGLQRVGKSAPLSLHASVLHFARFRRRMMRILNEGLPTSVHHDCHPDNFFWHGTQPGFLDRRR